MFSLLSEGPYVCVNCGFPYNKDVYKIYGNTKPKIHSRSPSTANTSMLNGKQDVMTHRLTKCEQCRKLVDEYVELDHNILFLDAILQKQSFYRHILQNCQISNRDALKMVIIFCICEAFQKWIKLNGAVSAITQTLTNSSNLISSKTYFQLEMSFYLIFVCVMLENALFNILFYCNIRLFFIIFARKKLDSQSYDRALESLKLTDIFISLILCSYGKLFLIPSYLYAGDLKVIVDFLIQLFCLLSFVQCATVKGYLFLNRLNSFILVALTCLFHYLLVESFRYCNNMIPYTKLLNEYLV